MFGLLWFCRLVLLFAFLCYSGLRILVLKLLFILFIVYACFYFIVTFGFILFWVCLALVLLLWFCYVTVELLAVCGLCFGLCNFWLWLFCCDLFIGFFSWFWFVGELFCFGLRVLLLPYYLHVFVFWLWVVCFIRFGVCDCDWLFAFDLDVSCGICILVVLGVGCFAGLWLYADLFVCFMFCCFLIICVRLFLLVVSTLLVLVLGLMLIVLFLSCL